MVPPRFLLHSAALAAATLAPLAALHDWGMDAKGNLYFVDGKVSMGRSTPLYGSEVSIESTEAFSLRVENDASEAIRAHSLTGTGVHGWAQTGTGVYGGTADGVGLDGHAGGTSGVNYGVKGYTNSPDGFAGHFYGGKNYFQGDVGIGTTSPQATLHVDESGPAGMVLNADNRFFVNGSNNFVGVGRDYQITGAEAFGIHRLTSSWGGMYISTSSSNGLPFYGYASGGNVDAYHYYQEAGGGKWHLALNGTRLTVNRSNGYVGIGYSNPSYRLHVNGSAAKPGGGSWTNSSDRRLKKNIAPLESSLDRLLELDGVTFEYKDPEAIQELAGERTGMIAQDVEEVFPDWVEEGQDGFKRLTYRGFEALTVEALRELRLEKDREIAELRAAKEAEIAALEKRLERLESAVAHLAEDR